MEDFLLAAIEEAMLAKIQAAALVDGRGQMLEEFDVRAGVADINKTPAVSVATEAIDHKVVGGVIRVTPAIAVYMVFKSMKSPKARRHGVYPILEGIVQVLSKQDLGLEIEELVPGRATEVVSEELDERGMIAFKIPFTTAFDVERLDDSTPSELLKIGIEYYLQNPDDGVVDAQDEVEIPAEA